MFEALKTFSVTVDHLVNKITHGFNYGERFQASEEGLT